MAAHVERVDIVEIEGQVLGDEAHVGVAGPVAMNDEDDALATRRLALQLGAPPERPQLDRFAELLPLQVKNVLLLPRESFKIGIKDALALICPDQLRRLYLSPRLLGVFFYHD